MEHNPVIESSGDGPGTVRSVLKILKNCVSYVILLEQWSALGRNLGIEEEHINTWRRDRLVDKLTFDDIMIQILNTWKMKRKDKATLKELCGAIELLGSNGISDELKMKVINSVVPKKLKYYISRTLSLRNRIDPKIFKEVTRDIFVISGLEGRAELSKLAEANNTDTSRNQVKLRDITVRFILLQHPPDYCKICEKAKNSTVHLIHKENGAFFCKKTQGSLELIQKFINLDQKLLSEEEFVSNILGDFNNTPVCIADSPGMGKTLLLESIAQQVQTNFTERTVLFFPLHAFIKRFGSKANDPDKLFHDLENEILPITSDEIKLELFLDGFDEVLPGQVEQTKILFQSLRRMKAVRIHVTTRPHMTEELEQSLGVLGYNIQPFNLTNQVDFLRQFWKTKYGAEDNDKLITFSNICLAKLKNGIRDSGSDIAGIPLQCMMIAEVFSDDACCYSNGSVTTVDVHITSIFDMYQKLMAFKFGKCSKLQGNFDSEKMHIAHVASAMQLIFPNWFCSSPQCINPSGQEDLSKSKVYSLGLMEAIITKRKSSEDSTTDGFVHRTFAEFLIAQHLVQEIFIKNCNECATLLFENVLGECQPLRFINKLFLSPFDCLFQLVMFTSQYPVISFFVNCFLEAEQVDLNKIQPIVSSIHPYTDCKAAFKLLSTCATSDLHKCFEILRNTLSVHLEEIELATLLVTAAYFSTRVSMMEQVLRLVDQCWSRPFTELPFPKHEAHLLPNDETYITPLHVSIMKGSYNLTEYLIQLYAENIQNLKNLLNFCVYRSMDDNLDIIEEKQEIIKLIVTKKKNAFNEKYENKTPLFQRAVHPLLIRTLVEQGADVNQLDENRDSLLHHISRQLHDSHKECNELFKLVLSQGFQLVNHLNHLRLDETLLQFAVSYFEPDDELLNCFQSSQLNFNSRDKNENSVLFTAIEGGRSVEFIHKLISTYGCDLAHNRDGQSVLHVAAQSGNYDVVRYLVNNRLCSVNDLDKSENTPLHEAVTSYVEEENDLVQMFLIERGAKLEAVNAQGFIPLTWAFHSRKLLKMEVILKMEKHGLRVERYADDSIEWLAVMYRKILPEGEKHKIYPQLFQYFEEKCGTTSTIDPDILQRIKLVQRHETAPESLRLHELYPPILNEQMAHLDILHEDLGFEYPLETFLVGPMSVQCWPDDTRLDLDLPYFFERV